MIIILISNKIHLTIILYTIRRIKDRINTMTVVDIEIEPPPHSHRSQVVILDGLQIGIARLEVQAVLIDDIAAQ